MGTRAKVQQLVIIDAEDLDEAKRIAADNGVELEEVPTDGFEPVTTITLLILGGSAAVGLVSYLLDKPKGGQVIDLRPGAPKAIYRSKDVVYGTVIIITADGKVEIEVKEPRGVFGEVIDALRGIVVEVGKAGVDAVASAAKAAVGDKATVSATRAPAMPAATSA
jgi:hypothetical protein